MILLRKISARLRQGKAHQSVLIALFMFSTVACRS